MRPVSLAVVFAVLTACAAAQRAVEFPALSGAAQVKADVYGSGTRAVILAHGGRFGKESWAAQARVLADAGFQVLALQFRGDGPNPDGTTGSFGSDEENAADVLAAVRYLKGNGAATIDAVGGSLGGDAVGTAYAEAPAGTFRRMVFLASEGGAAPEKLGGAKLFLVARGDRSGEGLRLPRIREHYRRAPGPKRLVVVKGEAHAQFLFGTAEGPRVLREMVRFLGAP